MIRVCAMGGDKLKFDLTNVNKRVCHCHSWLARQYHYSPFQIEYTKILIFAQSDLNLSCSQRTKTLFFFWQCGLCNLVVWRAIYEGSSQIPQMTLPWFNMPEGWSFLNLVSIIKQSLHKYIQRLYHLYIVHIVCNTLSNKTPSKKPFHQGSLN